MRSIPLFALVALLALSACASDSSSPAPENGAPVASAGVDRQVAVGGDVVLDGGASADPDGDALSYAWTLVSRPDGSAAALSGETLPQASFVADVAGAYVVRLVVSDGQASSAPDDVTVTATAAYPAGAYAWVASSPSGFTGFASLDLATGEVTPIQQYAGSFASGADFVGGRYVAVDFETSTVKTLAADGAAETLGTLTGPAAGTVTSVAYDAARGVLYAAAFDGSASRLYTVDPETFAATLVGTIMSEIVIGLAADAQGDLFAVDITSDRLHAVDRATGAGAAVGPLGLDLNYAQDIAFDRASGVLYGALYDGAGVAPGLYTIDVQTGAATLVAPTPSTELDGLAIPY